MHNPTMAEIETWVAQVMTSATPTVPVMDVIEGTIIESTG